MTGTILEITGYDSDMQAFLQYGDCDLAVLIQNAEVFIFCIPQLLPNAISPMQFVKYTTSIHFNRAKSTGCIVLQNDQASSFEIQRNSRILFRHYRATSLRGVRADSVASSIRHLKVSDGRKYISVRFVPLPLLATNVDYSNIPMLETDWSLLLDGWGIHISFRCGCVWDLLGMR